jgi:hypothetical protein
MAGCRSVHASVRFGWPASRIPALGFCVPKGSAFDEAIISLGQRQKLFTNIGEHARRRFVAAALCLVLPLCQLRIGHIGARIIRPRPQR